MDRTDRMFFIVGAQRSGTTYLYTVLDCHPQICMAKPVRPEPKYFINRTAGQVDLDFYFKKFFSHCDDNHKVLGEKSTSYYEHPETPYLISRFFPDAKILFILRNPVDRALSNYKFNIDNGIETRSLEEVFLQKKPAPQLNFKPSVDPFNYLGRGEYAKFIANYLKYFTRQQIYIVIFEEMVANPGRQLRELYGYLGVDTDFLPAKLSEQINKANAKVYADQKVIDYLTTYFKPHIEQLETLIDKDLSIWKKR